MITELISVGTEILLGNIVNTNSAYLSEKCALLGLSVYYQDVVGDNEGRMRDVIRTALDRSDVVILTGGLGPTEDDITKEVTILRDVSRRTTINRPWFLREPLFLTIITELLRD